MSLLFLLERTIHKVYPISKDFSFIKIADAFIQKYISNRLGMQKKRPVTNFVLYLHQRPVTTHDIKYHINQ